MAFLYTAVVAWRAEMISIQEADRSAHDSENTSANGRVLIHTLDDVDPIDA